MIGPEWQIVLQRLEPERRWWRRMLGRKMRFVVVVRQTPINFNFSKALNELSPSLRVEVVGADAQALLSMYQQEAP